MKGKTIDNLQHDWPQPTQFKKSIKVEFSVYVSGMVLLLMVIAGLVITDRYVEVVTKGEADKLLVQARSYSGPAGKPIISTTGPDALLLNNICRKLAADNPDIYWAAITSREDTILAHTDITKVAARQTMKPIIGGQYSDLLKGNEGFELAHDTISICVPIKERDLLVGRLFLASSAAKISDARNSSIMVVVSVSLAVFLLGLPLTMIGLHRKLKPIRSITDNLKNIKFDDIDIQTPVTRPNELGYLAATLRVMGEKLKAAQKDIIEKERISRELEIAREIQANILPRNFPSDKNYCFSGYYRSAFEVGGDYYDFIELPQNKLAFLVADVSGKSLPGMLVMLLTRDMVKRHAQKILEPHNLLKAVNEELLTNIKKGMFVTMFYGILDRSTGQFSFASAGHNPLIVLSRTGKPRLIKTKGYPLGMVDPEQFDTRIEKGVLNLKEGDWLIQYTDGVNEANNFSREEFGMDRLITQLSRNISSSPGELINSVIAEIDRFVGDHPQFDDITMIAMKFSALPVDNTSNKKEVLSNVG